MAATRAGRAAIATTAGACRAARAACARRPAAAEPASMAAHGLPLKCCTLAATTRPVPGTSTLAISRNMCGRSLGSRPVALVRSLGSRPKTMGLRRRDGAHLRACRVGSAGRLQAVGSSRTCRSRTPASHASGASRRRSRGRCRSSSSLADWSTESADSAGALTSRNTGRLRPSGSNLRSLAYWPPTSVHPMKLAPSLRT